MDLRNRFVKSATGQNWAKLYQNSNCENAANWPHIVKSVTGRMNYSVSLFIEFPKKELKENILNNKERMEGRKVRWHRRWLSLRGEKTGKSTQCRSKRGNIFYFNLERNEREKKRSITVHFLCTSFALWTALDHIPSTKNRLANPSEMSISKIPEISFETGGM